MRLLTRHQFANDRAFETVLLSPEDQRERELPECDVIGFRRVTENGVHVTCLRPDEALIMARMLIDAVREVTEGYEIGARSPLDDLPIPIVADPTVPKDEIHLRSNDGKTQQRFRL